MVQSILGIDVSKDKSRCGIAPGRTDALPQAFNNNPKGFEQTWALVGIEESWAGACLSGSHRPVRGCVAEGTCMSRASGERGQSGQDQTLWRQANCIAIRLIKQMQP